MATLKPEIKVLKIPVGQSIDTEENWSTINPPIAYGHFVISSDNKKIKLGEVDDKTWNELEYLPFSELTKEQLFMLQKANEAGGVLVLDETGKLPITAIPDIVATPHVVYVADIAARDALDDETKKTSLIFVVDASADDTVTQGSALYVYREDTSEDPSTFVWEKLFETESLDIDLSPYFDTTKHTSDDITEGTVKLFMTAEEREKLVGIEENADVTDADNVAAAGALMVTDSILFYGLSAEEMQKLYTVE